MINKVKALRIENNVSQYELCNYVRISRQALSSIEKGVYPRLEVAYKIAKFFDSSIEDVFNLSEKNC